MLQGYGALAINGENTKCPNCNCTTGYVNDDGDITCMHCGQTLRRGYAQVIRTRDVSYLIQNLNYVSDGDERDS